MTGPNLRFLGRAIGNASRRVLGVVYPPSCVGCGAATDEPHALCPACWSGMRLIERPYCERLGTPFALDLGVGPLLSPRAMADPPVYERARAVALYEGTARDLIHRLKYGDRLDLRRAMGRMMATAGRDLVSDADLLVPVPLHVTRLWSRRFNQAAILAREIGRIGERVVDLQAIVRVKATRPQVGLTRNQRGENLKGAFRVRDAAKPKLDGKRVLIIDDVTTTGATGNAVARVLLRARCAQVDLLTFATVANETV